MSFDPKPGMQFFLKDQRIEFTSLDAAGPASKFVYAETGKESIVYRVTKNAGFHALKVFYPDYQNARLVRNKERLAELKDLRGITVADRIVIDGKLYPELVKIFPELNYSVLMPWIQGDFWGNLISRKQHIEGKKLIWLAQLLLETVCNLESRGWAHCDLSPTNFIFGRDFSSLELIDLETMYAPAMPRPIPDISYGTAGYRTRWIAEHGLWGPEGDRFASAILCAEIVAWQFEEVRESRAGDNLYFREDEIGEKSERYQVMHNFLNRLDLDLSILFERAWFSSRPEQCPSVCEWKNVINKINMSTVASENEGSQVNDATAREGSPIVKSKYQDKVLSAKSRISISYPKRLSKRFASTFLLQVYFGASHSQVLKNARVEFEDTAVDEKVLPSSVRFRQTIKIKFFNSFFTFSTPDPELIDTPVTKIILSGTPNDNCEPGLHNILITISDSKTGLAIESLSIKVKVVDFAFDHVSRPWLSKVSTMVFGIGSFVMFMLTFLEQVDKTVGLTSGTAAGVLAMMVYVNFYNMYQRIRPNTP